MTAYAIHAYDFKLKKFIYPFILMIMMIPTQVTALGFIKLITGMGLMDSFIPLIVPAIASPVTFFYMKQYMESALPLSLIEAARIDGSGEFRTFNSIVLPLMKPRSPYRQFSVSSAAGTITLHRHLCCMMTRKRHFRF